MAGEIEVGLKVTGQRDLKNVRLEALKLQAAAGIASSRTKRLSDTFDKNLGPALRDVNRKMKQNLVLQQQSQKGNRRLGLLTQQAGYQFGDLAVQIQGGTNAAVAFGQQMSQLAGFFGPTGAIVGLGIALSTAVIAPIIRARKAASEFIKELKEVNKELELLRSGAENAGVLAINKQIATLTKEIYDLRDPDVQFGKGWDDFVTPEQRASLVRALLFEAQIEDSILNTKLKQLNTLHSQRSAMGVIKALMGDQVTEAESLDEIRQYNIRAEFQRQLKLKKQQEEYRKKARAAFLKDQAERFATREKAEEESLRRRRSIEELYITDMAALFLSAQLRILDEVQRARARQLKMMANEDALMSQDVVSGPATDRFGVDDLLRMGYTKEYLIAIGKLKEDEAKKTKKIEINTRDLTEVERQRFNLLQKVDDIMASSLMSMVDGTKSVSDAFKSMASEIIKELYRIYVVKQITGMITGYIGDPAMFGGGNGASMSSAPPSRSFAGGGYTGGGSRSGGLDGQGGFMAMLHPQETIVDHSNGQSGSGVTIVQNINVSTGVQQTVRAEIRQMMPQIANSAKAAVVDAKRRGGSYGKAFA